jgi:muconolactone delta-isomerase
MLFFVKGGPEGGPPPLSPEQLLEYVIKEWETVINFKQKGKVLESYGYVDHPGGFVIFNVNSREELDELISKLPMHSFSEFEISPLITSEQALARAKQGNVSGPAPDE